MINLFKQNEGFNTSTYKGKTVSNDFIQVEDSVYKDLKDHKLMWSNGELVVNPNYETCKQEQELKKLKKDKKKRIVELKQLLSDSDYRAIKYAEGLYTQEEYAPYKYQRQSYRDEINQLEEELNNLI